MKKLIYGVPVALLMPFLAFADAISTSTAPTVILNFTVDAATIIGTVIGSILGLYAALLGLGWGVRKFRHYISGRKF